MPRQSFENFYYTKVGLGEGCGCAEKVIDVFEFNRLAGKTIKKGAAVTARRTLLTRLVAWLPSREAPRPAEDPAP